MNWRRYVCSPFESVFFIRSECKIVVVILFLFLLLLFHLILARMSFSNRQCIGYAFYKHSFMEICMYTQFDTFITRFLRTSRFKSHKIVSDFRLKFWELFHSFIHCVCMCCWTHFADDEFSLSLSLSSHNATHSKKCVAFDERCSHYWNKKQEEPRKKIDIKICIKYTEEAKTHRKQKKKLEWINRNRCEWMRWKKMFRSGFGNNPRI